MKVSGCLLPLGSNDFIDYWYLRFALPRNPYNCSAAEGLGTRLMGLRWGGVGEELSSWMNFSVKIINFAVTFFRGGGDFLEERCSM